MPDRMTPTWSQALALVRQSPYWGDDYAKREAFVERAAQYATNEDLPRGLQVVYKKALRRLKER